MAALVCRNIGDLCRSNPFCIVVTASTIVNLSPIFVGLQSLPTASSCNGSFYCTISLLFSLTHIAASVYVAAMISNRNSRRLAGKNTAVSRFTWLLCHDAWVAAYIVILLLFIAWLSIGVTWRLDDTVHEGSYCPHRVGKWVSTCLGCGFGYFTALFWSLVGSFCVACCCDKKDYSAPYGLQPQQQTHQEPQHQAQTQAPYVQYQSQSSPGKKQNQYGATGGISPPIVSGNIAAVAPPVASAPPYDANIPTAVATPVVDAKPY